MDDENDMPRKGGRRQQRWQGQIYHRMLGEASLRPASVADLDAKAKEGLTQEQIHTLLTSADEKRDKVVAKVIEKPI